MLEEQSSEANLVILIGFFFLQIFQFKVHLKLSGVFLSIICLSNPLTPTPGSNNC